MVVKAIKDTQEGVWCQRCMRRVQYKDQQRIYRRNMHICKIISLLYLLHTYTVVNTNTILEKSQISFWSKVVATTIIKQKKRLITSNQSYDI